MINAFCLLLWFKVSFSCIYGWPKVYSSSVEVWWVEVRSITANWHLGLTSSLSLSTINYSLTLALAPEWPWQATLSSIPPWRGARHPHVEGAEQFWAETPVPNVLRAKLLFPFCLPVTIIFRFNIINVTYGQQAGPNEYPIPNPNPKFFNTRSVPDLFSKSSGISGIGYFTKLCFWHGKLHQGATRYWLISSYIIFIWLNWTGN